MTVLSGDQGEAAYYLEAEASAGMRLMGQRQPVSVLQHNSVVIALAYSLDACSMAAAATPANQYAADANSDPRLFVSTYHGPITAYDGREVPAVGWMAAPTAAPLSDWWLAGVEMLRRLADGLEIVAPSTAATTTEQLPAAARLVLVYGVAREALIPLRAAKPGVTIKEPTADGSAQNVKLLYDGLGYATGGGVIGPGSPSWPTQPSQADLDARTAGLATYAAATALQERLSAEYRAETTASNRRAAIAVGVLVAGAAGARAAMS